MILIDVGVNSGRGRAPMRLDSGRRNISQHTAGWSAPSNYKGVERFTTGSCPKDDRKASDKGGFL